MLSCNWRAPACWLAALLLAQLLYSPIITAQALKFFDGACPFTYEEHSLEDIRTGVKRPYLFGGVYNQTQRDCINCKRGGLWSSFCSFTSSGKAQFWDQQLCSSSTVDAAIQRALGQNNHDLLSMTPCDMWRYLRGRTTWIIGDSMSKDLYKALKCFMIEFMDLNVYHASNNYTAMYLLGSIPGYGEPHCVHLPQRTRLCQVHAIQGDLFVEGNRTKIGVLPLLQEELAHPSDIFIMNFGLWHGETKQPEYREALHQLGKFYDKTKSTFPNMFWFETPKQHFDSADGDYKVPWIGKRKGPFTCQAVQGLSMDKDGKLAAEEGNAVAEYVMQGSWRNIMAREVLVEQYHMPVIPVYNSSATAWQFHRQNFDGQECSHYCHPSIPQLWIWTLKSTFQKLKLPVVTRSMENKRYRPGCATVLERDEGQYGGAKSIELVLKEKHELLKQEQLRKQREQQQRAGFWAWLFRWKQPALAPVPVPSVDVMDSVAIFPGDASADGSSTRSESSSTSRVKISVSHSKTLHPWQVLEKVYEGQVQQRHHHRRQRQAHSDNSG